MEVARTQLGVGVGFMDHAAGVPLRERDSDPPPYAPPPPSYAPNPSVQSGAWRAQAQPWNEWSTQFEGMARPSEVPVDLPMRSYGKVIAIAAAVLVAFVAIAVSVVATGISSTISLPHSAAEPAAPTEPARVGVATPATAATTDSTAITLLPAAAFGAGAAKPVTPGAPRRADIVQAR